MVGMVEDATQGLVAVIKVPVEAGEEEAASKVADMHHKEEEEERDMFHTFNLKIGCRCHRRNSKVSLLQEEHSAKSNL